MARNFESDFDAVLDALGAWPELPSPLVLNFLSQSGDFEQDWSKGKEMQRDLPMGRVPYSCECEVGAGFWDRITQGAWKADPWQPIETAPHNERVLLFCPDRGVANPERIELDYASQGTNGTRSYHSWATHWRPVPRPPVIAGDSDTESKDGK